MIGSLFCLAFLLFAGLIATDVLTSDPPQAELVVRRSALLLLSPLCLALGLIFLKKGSRSTDR